MVSIWWQRIYYLTASIHFSIVTLCCFLLVYEYHNAIYKGGSMGVNGLPQKRITVPVLVAVSLYGIAWISLEITALVLSIIGRRRGIRSMAIAHPALIILDIRAFIDELQDSVVSENDLATLLSCLLLILTELRLSFFLLGNELIRGSLWAFCLSTLIAVTNIASLTVSWLRYRAIFAQNLSYRPTVYH
ncbi:unnamed protein product, partial [Mesorhabditis spiculigera]